MAVCALLLLLLLLPNPGFAQSSGTAVPNRSLADFKVYTEHPRLWLEGARLRRLGKDVERESDRWRQLRHLDRAGAEFPEEPLLRALQSQLGGDEKAGRKAIEWALARIETAEAFEDAVALRLGAVVFDWCYELLSEEERPRLAAALAQGVEFIAAQSGLDVVGVRSALLAAVAVAGDWDGSAKALQALAERRWDREILPALFRGEVTDRGADLLALLEICHATRTNLEIDLWQQAHAVFKPLPLVMMLGYYPQPVSTPGGLLRQPAAPSSVELDVQVEGRLRRIAEMMLVAYENTLQEYQLMQGWLRHDSYTLKDPFGAVYEFLWLNPYLPGLSYFSAPPVVHDTARGRVFARAGWQEEDLWFGYLDGQLQIFAEGERIIIERDMNQAPLVVPGAAVVLGRVPMKFKVTVPPVIDDSKVPYVQALYIVGLGEGQSYRVKINKEPFKTYQVGRGGILVLENRPEEDKLSIDFEGELRVQIKAARRSGPSLKGGSPSLGPSK